MELIRTYEAHWLELPKSGLQRGRRSMARNLGSKKALGDILLYLDGDTLIDPQYIENIRLIHLLDHKAMLYSKRYSISLDEQQKGSAHCLQIAIDGTLGMSDSAKKPQSFFSSTLISYLAKRLPMLPFWKTMLPFSTRWDWCFGNNLSVRKSHVENIGYWDEHFVGWGEEDIDFVYRLYISGCHPVVIESGPIYAYHLDHKVNYQQKKLSHQRNFGYIVNKFPEMKNMRLAYNVDYYYNLYV